MSHFRLLNRLTCWTSDDRRVSGSPPRALATDSPLRVSPYRLVLVGPSGECGATALCTPRSYFAAIRIGAPVHRHDGDTAAEDTVTTSTTTPTPTSCPPDGASAWSKAQAANTAKPFHFACRSAARPSGSNGLSILDRQPRRRCPTASLTGTRRRGRRRRRAQSPDLRVVPRYHDIDTEPGGVVS